MCKTATVVCRKGFCFHQNFCFGHRFRLRSAMVFQFFVTLRYHSKLHPHTLLHVLRPLAIILRPREYCFLKNHGFWWQNRWELIIQNEASKDIFFHQNFCFGHRFRLSSAMLFYFFVTLRYDHKLYPYTLSHVFTNYDLQLSF